MPCPRCVARGKTWQGDDPVCAFGDDGIFRTDNWNCATMNALRDLAERGDSCWSRRDDMGAGSIGVVSVYDGSAEEDWQGFYIVMTWYKGRGRTSRAYAMEDDHEPRPLTLAQAEMALGGGG